MGHLFILFLLVITSLTKILGSASIQNEIIEENSGENNSDNTIMPIPVIPKRISLYNQYGLKILVADEIPIQGETSQPKFMPNTESMANKLYMFKNKDPTENNEEILEMFHHLFKNLPELVHKLNQYKL